MGGWCEEETCVCGWRESVSECTPFLFKVVFSLSDHDDVQVLLVRLEGEEEGEEEGEKEGDEEGEEEGEPVRRGLGGGGEQRFNQQVGFTYCPTSANLLAFSYSPCSK